MKRLINTVSILTILTVLLILSACASVDYSQDKGVS